jgi:hypothetical protein
VMIDGEPLRHGFVRLVPTGDRPATGDIGADGQFILTTFEPHDGCVSGTHAIEVTAVETVDPTTRRWHAPQRYSSAKTSGLSVNINRPAHKLLIQLTWGQEEPLIEHVAPE